MAFEDEKLGCSLASASLHFVLPCCQTFRSFPKDLSSSVISKVKY